MKFVNQSAELIQQKEGIQGIFDIIAECAATCYKSTPKTGDSAKEFVDKLIKNGHTAMLEFGTVYLSLPEDTDFVRWIENPYSKITRDENGFMVTTNYRVLVENNWLEYLDYIVPPTKNHIKRKAVRIITSIGIARELTRHRVFSFAQESTRYCNYSSDKFGNEVSFVVPSWYHQINDDAKEAFCKALKGMEDVYLSLLGKWENRIVDKRFKTGFKDNPLTPQQAREVLPLCTKSEICICGFEDDWKHFMDLRLKGTTGAPHPEMKILAEQINELIK